MLILLLEGSVDRRQRGTLSHRGRVRCPHDNTFFYCRKANIGQRLPAPFP